MELFLLSFLRENTPKNFLENSSFLARKFIFFLVPREESKPEENAKHREGVSQMSTFIYKGGGGVQGHIYVDIEVSRFAQKMFRVIKIFLFLATIIP